jgi:hypothetical protein
MDDIFVIRERSKKKFSKIFFSIQDYTSIITNEENLNSSEEKRDASSIKMNKYLSIFRKNFKVNSNVNRNIMKYFSTEKAALIDSTTLQSSHKNKRYSVLKTFLSRPEIKYNNRNVSITLYIYNKKNMFLLKKIKSNFDLIKAKLKNNSIDNLYDESRTNLRNKFLFKLNNKSSITFFLYM